jgi:hypothetical protein
MQNTLGYDSTPRIEKKCSGENILGLGNYTPRIGGTYSGGNAPRMGKKCSGGLFTN